MPSTRKSSHCQTMEEAISTSLPAAELAGNHVTRTGPFQFWPGTQPASRTSFLHSYLCRYAQYGLICPRFVDGLFHRAVVRPDWGHCVSSKPFFRAIAKASFPPGGRPGTQRPKPYRGWRQTTRFARNKPYLSIRLWNRLTQPSPPSKIMLPSRTCRF